jgi:hypothetical protein
VEPAVSPLAAAPLWALVPLDPELVPLPAAAPAVTPEPCELVLDPHAKIRQALDQTVSQRTLFLMRTPCLKTLKKTDRHTQHDAAHNGHCRCAQSVHSPQRLTVP